MGFYVQVPEHKNKAQQLVELFGGACAVRRPLVFQDIPVGKALICVIDNGLFEAAAICYSEVEFTAFANDRSDRSKIWILMDWERVFGAVGPVIAKQLREMNND